ncbi:MAG: LptE family protein [Lewinellaceae bacterium]|nr:LptE family protein [Lewinellaceae bacterium]
MKNWKAYCLLGVVLLMQSCYSFRGISIDPAITTFYVAPFENRSPNATPTLAPDFTELLKDKIRNESRLVFTDTDPDVEFVGAITTFNVTSEAPQPGEQVSFNRLTIGVSVDYINNRESDEKKRTTKINKSFYSEFPSDQNLFDVQDELIRTISTQLVEDVFTAAFTNW